MRGVQGNGADDRPTLDAIRDQLRSRGYLRGPLTGWVAGRRGGRASPVRIGLAAGLKVGLVGGPLLALPASAIVAVANRPHFSAPTDFLWLSLYLSLVIGSAIAVLEFLTDVLLGFLARRGLVLVGTVERLAGRAGLLFTAATTLYLASFLRGGRAALGGVEDRWPSGLAAWLLWGAAIVAALGIGHLIGRLTRVGSLVSLVAAGVSLPSGGGPEGGARRGRAMVALGTTAILITAAALVFAPAMRGGGGAAMFQAGPLAGRVIVIGIDGLDAALFDRLRDGGSIPALASLEASGARYDIAVTAPRVPPVAWTSIATGQPSSEHGVLGYQADRVAGVSAPVQDPALRGRFALSLRLLLPPVRSDRAPVSAGLRRSRAIWEILADRGVEAAAVNWWATWPAVPAEGMVVSERALARLAAGLPPDRDAAPAELEQELARRFGADAEAARLQAAASVGADADAFALRAAVIDGYHALVARRLLASGLARVLFVYLPGIDIGRARLRLGADGVPPAVAALARHVDAIVRPLAEEARPEDLLLVVSDPGRAADREGTTLSGLLIVYGNRAVAGRYARPIGPLDIAPTVLALAGFPTARDMPGRAVLDFLRAGDPAARPPAAIATYGPRPEQSVDAGDPFEREVLDRLRSLGYIQ